VDVDAANSPRVRGAVSDEPLFNTRTGNPPGAASPAASLSAEPATGHDTGGGAVIVLSDPAFTGAFTGTFDTGVDLSGAAAAFPEPGLGAACAGTLTNTEAANAATVPAASNATRRDDPYPSRRRTADIDTPAQVRCQNATRTLRPHRTISIGVDNRDHVT
jgi:hypothetical protein